MSHTLQVAFVGGSGKKSFLERLCTGEFSGKAQDTTGTVVWPTSKGTITFHLTVHPSRTLSPDIFQAQGVVLFHDPSFGPLTLQDSEGKPIPQVHVWSKVDEKEEVRQMLQYCTPFCGPGSFYPISARSLYNFEKPLLSLARQLLGSDLQLLG